MYDDLGSLERLRGRSGVKQRLRRLQAEPLCRHCAARGKITAATVPDHIVPLSQGGTDSDNNIQCLCDDCHLIKTAIEGAANQGAANHPDWLRPSAIPLTIVSGPPCSGKTTYVRVNAGRFDNIIDLDSIITRIRPSYRHWHGMLDPELFNQAIRARNAMLGSLERSTSGRAWFIVSAPTKGERLWWRSKLGGEVVLLHPGREICHSRAVARGTPRAIKGVYDWERAAKLAWYPPAKPRSPKVQIGIDGWPVD